MTLRKFIPRKFSAVSLEIIDQANEIIEELGSQGFKLTLRQLYYQFVARGMIENHQRSYNKLKAIVSKARLAGVISWDAIEDRTRFLRGVSHEHSVRDALSYLAGTYRLNKWEGAYTRIEVWIEKDALVGVIERVCRRMDVHYFSCRGFVSLSAMWNAAERFRNMNDARRVVILHLGDHDPSGMDMTRDIQTRLNLLCPSMLIDIERIGLNMDQIEKFQPPPNPAKLSDSRAKAYIAKYGEESYELDALEPMFMEELIEEKVLNYRDEEIWNKHSKREARDRNLINNYANTASTE